MHAAKSILLLMSGMIAGIVFVISCGDNFRAQVDAAIDTPKADPDAAPTCDCPTVEPPLAGRFVVVSQVRIIAANNHSGESAVCPVGSHVISGSCTTDVLEPVRNVTLMFSGVFDVPPSSWHCEMRNHEVTPVPFRVSVICLIPPA